jgi:hypothetical protein
MVLGGIAARERRAAPTDVANAENVSGSRSSGGDVRTLSRGSCGARRALQRRIVDRRSLVGLVGVIAAQRVEVVPRRNRIGYF